MNKAPTDEENVMQEIRTVCSRDCYDTCFVVAGVDDAGKILSVKGDPENPVTQGITCPRCAKDANRVYQNRIHYPHVRSDSKPGWHFSRLNWDNALDRVAEKLRHTLDTWGPESVLLLKYAGNTGLLAGTFPVRLWNAIGATRTDNGLCSQSGHVGLEVTHFLVEFPLPLDDGVDPGVYRVSSAAQTLQRFPAQRFASIVLRE